MTDEDIQEQISIGGRLRNARESRELGIPDVAARLHLDSRIVTALEEDNFDVLPDPIYVRGYLRNYAKLLGIDADELVRDYESGGLEEPEIIPEIKYPTQTSSSDKPVKAFTYLLTLGLVMLLFAWWQSSFIVNLQTAPRPAQPVARTINPALVPVRVDAMPRPPAALLDLQEIAVEPETAAATGAADGGTPAVEKTPAPVPVKPPVLSRVDGAPAVENRLATYAGAPAGDTPAPAVSQAPAAGTPDQLVLNVSADSWIEITDALDRKIYFDLARTGDTLDLRGTAPFHVLLGFAQGVSIEYNGDQIDQAPYTRSGVARFTLGE